MTDDEKALRKTLRDVRRTLCAIEQKSQEVASSLALIDEVIGPLPMNHITGKDIHRVYEEMEPNSLSWDLQSNRSQQTYERMARMITMRCLAPLQELIAEWKVWAQAAVEDPETIFMGEETYVDLLVRSRELLGEDGQA